MAAPLGLHRRRLVDAACDVATEVLLESPFAASQLQKAQESRTVAR